jgi:hypothetical protein
LIRFARRQFERIPIAGRLVRRRFAMPTFGSDGLHPDLVARGFNFNSNAELLDYLDEVDGVYEQYRSR